MVSRRTRVASWIFRRDHPSRPKAMICCFFSSFKTFAMLREATYPPAAVNVLDVSSESMAAFQVIMYGRFWVFTEVNNFNHYFGLLRYQNAAYWPTPYWQGSYPAASNENFFGLININGQAYLILVLEFYPQDNSLSWAAQVIQNNSNAQVIIVTHAYEYFDNTRVSACNSFDAQYYGLGADNDGDAMWTKLVRQYQNISLVLSGHEVRGAGQD